MSDTSSNLDAAKFDDVFPLVTARAGMRCLIHSLGDTLESRLELLAAGLAPDQEVQIISVCKKRHCILACGQIRAAVGADLAKSISLRRCPVCGIDPS